MNKSNSKISSQNSKFSNNSKLIGESYDSKLLKENLQDFYKNSKDKLLRLKNEIDELEDECDRQNHENNLLNITHMELIKYNDELNLRIKGMKERILIAQKKKTQMQNQSRDIRKDTDSISKDIDTMKINNQYKVKLIQNDIDHVNVVKENNVKSIRNKIATEQKLQDSIIDKSNELRHEIARYKDLIKHTSDQDNARNKDIVKETDEMTKFLTKL